MQNPAAKSPSFAAQIEPTIQPRTIHTIKAIKQPLLEEELEFDELELLVDVVCLFADALFVVEALERAVEVGFL